MFSGLWVRVVLVFDSDQDDSSCQGSSTCVLEGTSRQLTRREPFALCNLQLLLFPCKPFDSCMQECKLEACVCFGLLIAVAIFGSLLSALMLGFLLLAIWCLNLLSTGLAAHQVRLLCSVQHAGICGACAVCHRVCSAPV